MDDGEPRSVRQAMRSVEAAAVAGLAYSGLTVAAGVMLTRAPEVSEAESVLSDWYQRESNQRIFLTALNLMTVGVIAFLWFVAVIRRRAGARENKFFSTVFIGSALLVSGMWLLGSMLLAIPAVAPYLFDVTLDGSDIALTRTGASILLEVMAARLEAVFVLSTTTLGRVSEVLPHWLVVLGYLIGLLLMLSFFPQPALTWIFPAWVALVSALLLIRRDAVRNIAATGK